MRRAGQRLMMTLVLLGVTPGTSYFTGHDARAQGHPGFSTTASAKPLDPKEAARAIGKEGVALYDAGKYAEAIERFKKAQALYPLPQNLAYVARCHIKLGHLILARDIYTEAVGMTLPADTDQKSRDAQSVAKEELAALKKRIPKLEISVVGVPTGTAKVTVDGVAVPANELSAREVDPGKHTIVASAAGTSTIERTVEALEGSTVHVDLEMPPTGPASGVSSVTSDAQSPMRVLPSATTAPVSGLGGSGVPNAADSAPKRSLLVPSLAVLGLGVAGIGVGAITGVLALDKAGELKEKCPQQKGCPLEDEVLAKDAHAFGAISTVGFVVGAAGLAAGAVLLIVGTPRRAAGTSGPIAMKLHIAPGSTWLTGDF